MKTTIPQRITDNPEQLRRVMQYHHPDKGNPDADPALYRRAHARMRDLRKPQRFTRPVGARERRASEAVVDELTADELRRVAALLNRLADSREAAS